MMPDVIFNVLFLYTSKMALEIRLKQIGAMEGTTTSGGKVA